MLCLSASSSRLLSVLALLSVLLLGVSIVAASTASVLGVHPNDLARYSGPQFRCHDNSKSIDVKKVNDDYCDCADGSDEPGTSACSNGSFWCRNRGHVGRFIPSSMVHDNICDCCDGSDEAPGVCQPDCDKQGAAQRQENIRKLRAIREGVRVRARWEEEGLAAYQSDVLQRIQSLKADIAEHEKTRSEHQAIIDSMEALYSEADKVMHPEPDSGNVHDDAYIREDDFGDADADGRDAGAAEHPDTPLDETAKALLIASEIDQLSTAFKAKHGISPKEVIKAYQKAENEYNAAKKDVEDRQIELRKLEEITQLDLDGGKMYKHYGQLVTFSTNEYTYTLNLFKEVQQGSYRLGDFEGWEDSGYKEMKYTKGQYCWGGPDRSTRVRLVCGASNEIKSVEEPAKCEYLMVLATPYACNAHDAKELEQSLSPEDAVDSADIV